MIRRTTMFWAFLSIAAGVWLFVVKHQVQALEGELQRLERAVVEEQEAIHVLTAEWSYLNRPARLDELGRRLMGLSPMTSAQQSDFIGLEEALQEPDADAGRTESRREPGLRLDATARAGNR